MKKIGIAITTVFIFAGAFFFYLPKAKTKLSPFIEYADLIPHTYRLGFTNLDKEVSLDNVQVKGTLPHWLNGTLFRNGPAKFTQGSSWVSNWFDGLAMIHAFSLHNGTVSYANKFLRTDDYAAVEKTGKMSYAGFAQDPCKSHFKQFFSWFMSADKNKKESAPNANVNIALYTNKFIALTETPLPIEFDPKTLETVGVMHYNDGLLEKDIHDTAHPHYDLERKEHIGYFTKFGRMSSHNIFKIKDESTKREIIFTLEIDKPSYMHSFFITKKYAILTLLPLVVNPLDLLLKKQAFIKNFKWQPERGTQLVVIDRINNKLKGIYKAEPFFSFHTVNAFEQDNMLVLDSIIYPNSLGIGEASFDKILAKQVHTQQSAVLEPDVDALEFGKLTRFTVDFSTGLVRSRRITDKFLELPRINYDQYNGKDYSYVYAYSKHDVPAYVANQLVKVNVKTGDTAVWSEDNCYPGEPIFVASPQATTEDDGVVLSVVLDVYTQNSFLLVLDAQTFKEVARAEVPHHIPFGIHGLYTKS